MRQDAKRKTALGFEIREDFCAASSPVSSRWFIAGAKMAWRALYRCLAGLMAGVFSRDSTTESSSRSG